MASFNSKDDFNMELPIAAFKNEIINTILDNKVVIIHGETGSGKTTQIPKYLYEYGIHENKIIGVTQPRRLATVAMARRVAEETHCALGKEVGYEIRFDNKSSGSTKIKYMTDGIMLNQCVSDQSLTEFSIIMIDEAHERVLRSDVLIGLLKEIVFFKRNDLKLIITSATIDPQKFSSYFFDAPIVYISGTSFPVEIIYNPSYDNDCAEAAAEKVIEIHIGGVKGDILVFLTGQEEIENCIERLSDIENLVALPLFAAIDFQEQQKIFQRVKDVERKVVIATNIAETSLTIDGIRFIVDCGYVKQSNFDSKLGMDVWQEVRTSKAQANQRKGRAGRTAPGWCYRLYREEDYNSFLEVEVPEIKRKNLSEIFLKVVAFGLDPKTFNFIDPPDPDALLKSEKELRHLNFLDDFGTLTEQGLLMQDLPIEPIKGKVILSSIKYGCVGDIIIILTMITEKSIFKKPRKFAELADLKRARFLDPDGDPFTLLAVYKEWIRSGKSESWCRENFIDHRKMQNIYLIQNQFSLILKRRSQYTPPSENSDKEAIKKSILLGYFTNLCEKDIGCGKSYSRCIDKETLFIFPGSSLSNETPSYVLYIEVRKTKKPYMHGVMRLEESFLNQFIE